MTKELGILKWVEAMMDHFKVIIRAQMAPVSCVIRKNATPTGELPLLEDGKLHTTANGSVAGDAAACTTHDSPLHHKDHTMVHVLVKMSLRGTHFATAIKPCGKLKDGRSAHMAIIAQHAGPSVWNSKIDECSSNCMERIWKGNANYTLERHVTLHRNSYLMMELCAEHVPHQLPNKTT